jgi:hypothetical protein
MTAGTQAPTLVGDMDGDRRVSGTEHLAAANLEVLEAAARFDQIRALRRRSYGTMNASTSHGQVDFETVSTAPSPAAAALHPSDATPRQSSGRAAAAATPHRRADRGAEPET